MAGIAMFGVPTASATGATPQPIGPAPVVPHGAVAVAAPAASWPLHLDVTLAPRNAGALDAFVTAVSTKGSPEYHQYLSKGQFAAEFGPTRTTVDAVTSALSAAGLRPGAVSADGLSIPVTTTVGAAAKALGTGFAGYRLSNGRVAYGNTAAPRLPSSVAGAVTGIVGLNNFVTQTPRRSGFRGAGSGSASTTPRADTAAPNSATPNSATPTICPSAQQNLAGTDTQNYWEPGTLSQSYAYDTAPLYNQYGNTGYGVTVGIFELENFSGTDVTDYQNCFGTHSAISTVTVDGGPSAPVSTTTLVGLESALDIETVAGLAPSAAIKVYQGPDAANATDANVLDTYQQMVTDDVAQVISTSWGTCELDDEQLDPNFLPAESTIFAEAAAQGQTVLAASGDSGSTGCFQNPNSSFRTQLSADEPAIQPNVTGVGGTGMTGTSGVESTWNSDSGGSGGGVSVTQTLSGSANYQSGVTGAGYSNACNAPADATCRQVPDVAALADPNEGYAVSFAQNAGGGWGTVGGTSGAAPLWAAITALADASTACAANGSVGMINPALYGNAGAMKDITAGNNDVTSTGYTGGLYPAGTGYDMATGLGSPHAPQLVEALCAAPKPSAGSSFTAAGPTRLLDTRNGTGAPQGPVGANSHISLKVSGVAGVPSSGVTAVVLNVTVTNTTLASFLTVYPDGTPRPASSNLNWVAGETIPNLVTVPVGADGNVDLYNFQGNVDLVADLFGYYTANGASKFQPMSPTRVLDTRNGTGVPQGALGPNGQITLPVTGKAGVPSTGVTAVVLNVTVTGTTAASFLTVFPNLVTRPVSSNLNWVAGETVPNLVTVPVGSDGAVNFFNFQGNTDVVADIFGYYTNSGSGFVFHPSAPHRLADTRSGIGVAAGQTTPVGANGVFGVPLSDTNGTGNNGPLSGAAALVLNVTATAPTLSGFVTVYPSGVSRPLASNLNFAANETIPNSVLTPVNGSSINFYNFQGTVQLVVDLFGYFAAS